MGAHQLGLVLGGHQPDGLPLEAEGIRAAFQHQGELDRFKGGIVQIQIVDVEPVPAG
jgi:hypothetical protein